MTRVVGTLVLRRVLVGLGVMALVSIGIFTLLELAPGSTEQLLVGPRPSTPELIEALRIEYNLDDSFLVRYWTWFTGAIHFDLGTSLRTSQPVTDAIGSAAPVTLFLGCYAFGLAMVGGITTGIIAALRQRSFLDRSLVAASVVGVSTPAFAMGIVLLYLFAVLLPWFPSLGAGEGFTDRLVHLTLPAIALALAVGALVVKLTRAAMINVLDQDYVAFAKGRGLSSARVLFAYALRNALVPVVSAAGLILGYVLTGAVLVEVTFNLPGLGALLVEAVATKDVPVVQAIALLFAAIVISINVLVDVLFIYIDPRIRIGGAK
jgi:peptide/nickel transport system permease protein